jgi:hypothetical protein
VKAGEVYGRPITSALVSIWIEELAEYSVDKLAGMFRHVLRTWKPEYGKTFPVPADVLAPLESAQKNAIPQAAEEAWEMVLDIRRKYWNPDIPGPLDRATARLSERVRQAARAAGVFRDFESVEALHIWAKKRFVESFAAYGDLERDGFLLPDGEIKNLLSGFAQTKMLPAPSQDWSECRARGEAYRSQLATQGVPDLSPEERLRVADQLAAAARKVLDQPREHVVVVSDEARIALRRQAEALKRSFTIRPEAFSEDPTLRKVYERFGLEIPEPKQTQGEPQKPGPVEVSA